uniref:Uncharacterized protein n=1 Tax=Megaviridae environmental sample TaxID=1737588 RepID=A0A5J6VJL4_9VIRU|nr:MAG: hypothetical protein [Megaviridae environmental sample]
MSALSPDTLSPDTLSPDTLSPDTLSPDTLSPDTLSPDTLSPDTLSPDTLSPDTTVRSPDPSFREQIRGELPIQAPIPPDDVDQDEFEQAMQASLIEAERQERVRKLDQQIQKIQHETKVIEEEKARKVVEKQSSAFEEQRKLYDRQVGRLHASDDMQAIYINMFGIIHLIDSDLSTSVRNYISNRGSLDDISVWCNMHAELQRFWDKRLKNREPSFTWKQFNQKLSTEFFICVCMDRLEGIHDQEEMAIIIDSIMDEFDNPQRFDSDVIYEELGSRFFLQDDDDEYTYDG